MMGKNVWCGGKVTVAALLVVVLSGTAIRSAEPVKWAKLVRTFEVPPSVVSMAPSPDGKLIAIGSVATRSTTPLTVWDLATGKLVANLNDMKDPFRNTRSVAFSPDGKLLAAVSERDKGGFVRIWDTATWRIVRRLHGKGARGGSGVAFSPNGLLLATSQERDLDTSETRGVVYLWEVKTGQLKATLDMESRGGRELIFSRNEKYLACCTGEHVFVWDTQTFQKNTIRWTPREFLSDPCFSADGKSFLVIENGALRVFETSSWREQKRLPTIEEEVSPVAYLPNGNLLAYFSHRNKGLVVLLYDYKLAREVMTIAHYSIARPLINIPVELNTYIAPSMHGRYVYVVKANELSVWDIEKLDKRNGK